MEKSSKTLLEKARDIPPEGARATIATDDEVDLAIAWLKREVTWKQLMRVVGLSNGGMVPAWVTKKLRRAIYEGRVTISRIGGNKG